MKSSRIRRLGASMGTIVLLSSLITFSPAAVASAQPVSDPQVAEFDPSPDHWQTLDNGQPAVLRYELGVYLLGGSAPFTTVDLGKPSPEGDGKIRYDLAIGVSGLPLPGGDYEARVSAIGPEGTGMSDPSNPFTITTDAPCTFALSTTAVTAAASGGNAEVDVVTLAGCEWATTNAPSWVTMWTGGGTGGGTLAFGIQANTSTSSRTGIIEVAGQPLTVSQDGAVQTCSFSVSDSVFSFPASSGTDALTVTTGPGCAWTVASSESWLVPAVTSGSGGSIVTFTVNQNKSMTNRQATLTVGPWAVTVFQSGKARRTR